MNKNLFVLLFALLLSFSSCISRRTAYEKIADQISIAFLNDVRKTYELDCISLGGSMMDDVKMMSVDFSIYKKCHVEEARKLIVQYAEEYLKKINENEKIRPYLHQSPFTYKDVEVGIIFLEKNGENLSEEYVSCVSLLKGVLYYRRNGKNPYRLYNLHKEPYLKALEIASKKKFE